MLGKNKIDRIHGLENLTKLDVLDMHSNNISELSGLTHQSSLRVLNLAGNKISQVHGLQKLGRWASFSMKVIIFIAAQKALPNSTFREIKSSMCRI